MKAVKFLPTLAALALLAACNNHESVEQFGRVSFAADISDVAQTRAGASLGLTLPSKSDFTLTVADSGGQSVVGAVRLGDYDTQTGYPVGITYTASVVYGSVATEAFETPCFLGSKQFEVSSGETTAVSIDAAIANAVVRITVTDAFQKWFDDYTFTVTSGGGTAFTFAKGETRRLFIDPYKFTVSGTGVRAGNSVDIASSEFADLQAAHLYTVKYDVNEGQIGSATITVTFDDSFAGSQQIDYELNDNN